MVNFRSLVPPEAWRDLVDRGRRRTFPRGTLLLRQGESPDSVIALLEGQVRVTQLNECGDELVLMLRGPGEVLGEMGALVGRPRSANVTAAQRCVGMVLPTHAFRHYVDRHKLQAVIYQLTVERLNSHERLRVALLHTSPVARIASVVSLLAEELGRPEGDTVVVGLGMARAELAAMASMKRSSAAMALGCLQAAGVLSLARRHLIVTDPGQLAAAARGEAYGQASGAM
ncbi:Crp/Fnr family transcriptional regulator [Kitasatospora sp. NPDC048286]|uniref:Crp/Fnr family transcriptional regulator n=1 Tax=Kitasatospora sp. NPDC048286 TaxID=3364047 RepID=UPI003723D0DB